MQNSNEIEKLIHEARMLSIRGQYAESVSKYQTAVNMFIDSMGPASDEEKTRMQDTLHMYLEEADAVKSVMNNTPFERQQMPNSSSPSSLPPVQSDSSASGTTFVEDLSKLFSDIGRGLKAFDEKYKVSESCEKMTNEVVNKTVDFVNRNELNEKARKLEDSLYEWDQTYHISDRISEAINTAADATTRIVDQIFPFMQNQPINSQPQDTESEPHSPENCIITSYDEASASPIHQEQSEVIPEPSEVPPVDLPSAPQNVTPLPPQNSAQPQEPVAEQVRLQEKETEFKSESFSTLE